MNEPEDPAAQEALDALNADPRSASGPPAPPEPEEPQGPRLLWPVPDPVEEPDEADEAEDAEEADEAEETEEPAEPDDSHEWLEPEERFTPAQIIPNERPTVDYGRMDLPEDRDGPLDLNLGLDTRSHRSPDRDFGMRHLLAGLTGVSALFAFGFAVATGNGGVWGLAFLLSVSSTLLALRIFRGSLRDAESRVLEELDLELSRTPSKQLKPAILVLRGERLLWETRLHPLKIFWWWVALGAACVGAIVLVATVASALVALGFWAVAMIPIGYKIYEWWHSTVGVTDRRLIAVEGVCTTKRPMMPLAKLTDEGIHIPAISRLLGQLRIIRTKYGSLVVESAGQDQALSRIDYFPAIEPVNQIIAGQAVPRGNDGS